MENAKAPSQPGVPADQPSRLWLVAFAALVLAFGYGRRLGAESGRAQGAPDAPDGGRRPQPRRADAADAARAREPGRGREADTPAQIPVRGWKDILWRVYEEMNQDRLLSVAAGVTFYVLLAIFPAIAAFVSLYGLFADATTIESHLNALSTFLPGGALDIIGEQIRRLASQGQGSLGLGFFIGLAVSLWSANAGIKALFDALNIVNDEEEKRSFVKLNAQSLLFTLGAILFLLVAIAATAVLPVMLKFIGLASVTEWLLTILRWPALLVLIMLALAVLYRYGPSRDQAEWRWVTWGSAIASLIWIVGSMLFSWYVANFGKYNETYGSLGAAIGFMTWIWLSTSVVLLGAELNAEMEHQTAKDTTRGAPAPLGQRRATMADTVGAARD